MQQYVTRKISGTEALIKVYDPATDSVKEISWVLPRKIPPDRMDIAERDAKSQLAKTDYTFIQVLDYHVTEKLYGITLEQFMEKAVPLDKRTRKPML